MATSLPTVPICGIDILPYIYSSYKQAWDARDGVWGSFLRSAIDKLDMHTFEKSWDFGFRQVYNNVRPINTPDDCRGLKLRTPAA